MLVVKSLLHSRIGLFSHTQILRHVFSQLTPFSVMTSLPATLLCLYSRFAAGQAYKMSHNFNV